MASFARLALLVFLALLAQAHAVGAAGSSQRVPCNITVEQMLEVAGWKPLGPGGSNKPIMECTPNGTIHTIYLVDQLLSGNLSGFTPFMRDLRILDLNGNRLTGERGGPACANRSRCCC